MIIKTFTQKIGAGYHIGVQFPGITVIDARAHDSEETAKIFAPTIIAEISTEYHYRVIID
jgi:hypothetical protein